MSHYPPDLRRPPRQGAGPLEYGLIAALIAIAALTGMQALGSEPDVCVATPDPEVGRWATTLWRLERGLRAEVRTEVTFNGWTITRACFWDGRLL